MNLRYFDFCLPGEVFFDKRPARGERFARPEASAAWTVHEADEWVGYSPRGSELPDQGWKIHVSGTPDNAQQLIDIVGTYCLPASLDFKFLDSPDVLLQRNGKYGDRSASGKLITIYPKDDAEFERTLLDLDAQLTGAAGPYILSDLRFRSGPLFVRYGGFTGRQQMTETGRPVYVIRDPQGVWVPDVRGPGFHPPEWVEIPDVLRDSLAARAAGTLADFPYRPTKALHFSNGGGVYTATHTETGESVLLKEARPLAGLDLARRDAVQRLEQEYWALEQLQGLDIAPRLHTYRRGHEHYFLVRELVEGTSLSQLLTERNPLLAGDMTPDRASQYVDWVEGIISRVADGLEQMHRRGIVFLDLHPNNIIVRPDDTIAFIDLEASGKLADDEPQRMGALGYQAPSVLRGVDVDRFALSCLRLGAYLPLTQAGTLDPLKFDELIDVVSETFPVGAGFAASVRDGLSADKWADDDRFTPSRWPMLVRTGSTSADAEWPKLRLDLIDGIRAAAASDRHDRLFGGDIAQFDDNLGGANLSVGAAGVLWALQRADADIDERHVTWMLQAAERVEQPKLGMYDGMSGIAFTLAELGESARAAGYLDVALDGIDLEQRDHSLYSGLAGIGLVTSHLAERWQDPRLRQASLAIGAAVRDSVPDVHPHPGLMQGRTGAAQLLVHLFRTTGDSRWLSSAASLLLDDVRDSEASQTGEVAAAWAHGRAGMACVAGGILALSDPADSHVPDLRQRVEDLRPLLTRRFNAHPGLFNGRASIMMSAASCWPPGEREHVARQHLADLGWHSVRFDGHLTFMGDNALRLSADLATGAAGVLAAGDTAFGGREPGLPLAGV